MYYYYYAVPSLLLKFDANNVIINQSDTLQLTCIFTGKPVPHTIWFHPTSQDNANRITIYSNRNETTVVSRLVLLNIKKSNEGTYGCRGINNVTNYVGYTEQYNESIVVQGIET